MAARAKWVVTLLQCGKLLPLSFSLSINYKKKTKARLKKRRITHKVQRTQKLQNKKQIKWPKQWGGGGVGQKQDPWRSQWRNKPRLAFRQPSRQIGLVGVGQWQIPLALPLASAFLRGNSICDCPRKSWVHWYICWLLVDTHLQFNFDLVQDDVAREEGHGYRGDLALTPVQGVLYVPDDQTCFAHTWNRQKS